MLDKFESTGRISRNDKQLTPDRCKSIWQSLARFAHAGEAAGATKPTGFGLGALAGTWLAALILQLGYSDAVLAQGISTISEYHKKIRAAAAIAPLGDDLFGNATNPATGKTVFSTIDIDIPGNSALPVQFGRRLPIEPRYIQEELGGIGNWDMDVPYIEATVSKLYGWSVAPSNSPNRYKRCSFASAPMVEGGLFSSEEVFHGYNVHIPGVLDDLMIANANNQPNPNNGKTHPWIVGDTGRVSCLPTIRNGQPGEGFVVHLPDGTRYFFDYPIERTATTLRKGPKYVPGYSLPRKRIFMLATRIEDRFGNWVNYEYNSGRLTGITSSDDRRISIQASASGITASSNGRDWQYRIENGHLTAVTNPDGSSWTFSPWGTYSARVDYPGDVLPLDYFSPEQFCQAAPEYAEFSGPALFTVTHPSGAKGDFTFSGTTFYRSKVQYQCAIDFFDHEVALGNWLLIQRYQDMALQSAIRAWVSCAQSSTTGTCDRSLSDFLEMEYTGLPEEQTVEISGYARILIPNTFPVMSLTRSVLSGPGLAPATTQYDYQAEAYPFCGIYDHQTGQPVGPTCSEDPCADGSCSDSIGRWTEVTMPNGDKVRKRYGVVFGVNEGLLLDEVVQNAQGTELRRTSSTYLDGANTTAQNFNRRVGWAFSPDPLAGLKMPLITRETRQDGDLFSWSVSTCGGATLYCFDIFGRPTTVIKANSIGIAKAEVTEYYDDRNLWVLGQTRRQLAPGTSVNENSLGETVVVAEQQFNDKALPSSYYSFGRLQKSVGYDAQGNITAITDGNGKTHTLSDYYRGIARQIVYPATESTPNGSSQRLTVDANGWITEVVDELGSKSCYAYDQGGRITRITYPSEAAPGICDTSTWAPVTMGFQSVASNEFGLPAGHWRLQRTEGNRQINVYYDALWRPVLEEVYDTTDKTNTLSQTVKHYDIMGRLAFTSYPQRNTGNLFEVSAGTRTLFDALDRPVRVEQTSELGTLISTTEYLDGLRTRVVNPRGQATISGYLAWDEPNYDLPISRIQPEGKVIQIDRHRRFGYPLRFIQRSANSEVQQIRRYVYDGAAFLCKTIDPEAGVSVVGYDAAGNQTWSATGLSANQFGDTTNCQHLDAWNSGRRVTRSFDALNRVTSVQFPDTRGNETWRYTADGLVASASVTNHFNGAYPVNTAYQYNKRRLLVSESLVQPGWYTWNLGYTYDSIGNQKSIAYPTGLLIDFAPNALGQATKAGNYASNASYHPNGALKQFTFGNGLVYAMQQNQRQYPYQSETSGGVLRNQYGYDANGNVDHIYDLTNGPDYSPRSRWMTYDNLDRLISVGAGMFGGDHWHRFTYDALDNLKSWKLAGVKDFADYVYDPQSNRLSNIRNSLGTTLHSFTYDPQGNVLSKDQQGFEFDFGNRLRGVAGKEYYRYDAQGRRVMSWKPDGTTVLWQYSQAGQMLFSWDGPTAEKTHEFVYLAGTLVATIDHNWPSNTVLATKYHHTDALGSPVAVTDVNGQVLERNDYEPFGSVIGKPNFSGIGYTGHLVDGGTGLTYMQQRYYDAQIGRFLSTDPVAADPVSGKGFNRYQYASNNPYRMVDPDGRFERDIFMILRRENPVKPDISVKMKVEADLNRYLKIALESNKDQLRGITTAQINGAKLSIGTDGKGELKLPGIPYPLKFDLGEGALKGIQKETNSITLGAKIHAVTVTFSVDGQGNTTSKVALTMGKWGPFSPSFTFTMKLNVVDYVKNSRTGQTLDWKNRSRYLEQCTNPDGGGCPSVYAR